MAVRKIKKLDLVFNELERRILNKVWKVGDQIPPEQALAAEFKCSRSTIGMAIAQLDHGGLVERRVRTGTHVISNTPNRQTAPLQLDACAFIYPSEQHEGVARMVKGFQQAAHELDRRVVLMSTGANIQKESEIISRLGEFDVKGAVIFPMMIDPLQYPFYSKMVSACSFPIVLVEVGLPETRRPAVVVDGFDAGYTMAKHLIAQGIRKIGFLANYGWVNTTRDKHLGYRRALSEAGLDDASYAMIEPEMHPSYDHPLEEPRKIATEYLKQHPDVEGVVCSSDFLAVGLLQVARESGRRVPRDLRITGMDDFALAAAEGLTTYRIPYEEIGRRAFEVLNASMIGTTAPGDIYVRGELVKRN